MNSQLSQGITDLLFRVIKHETSLILAVDHDDDAPLNRRAARILSMAHNKRGLDSEMARGENEVLGLIELEAIAGLGETREPQHAERLGMILETAQCRHLVGNRQLPAEGATWRFARMRSDTRVLPRMTPPAATFFATSSADSVRTGEQSTA